MVTIVTPTDRPKSVRNSCVIEVFGGVFVLSRCFFDFSVGVGAFVIGLSQISFFFFDGRYLSSTNGGYNKIVRLYEDKTLRCCMKSTTAWV